MEDRAGHEVPALRCFFLDVIHGSGRHSHDRRSLARRDGEAPGPRRIETHVGSLQASRERKIELTLQVVLQNVTVQTYGYRKLARLSFPEGARIDRYPDRGLRFIVLDIERRADHQQGFGDPVDFDGFGCLEKDVVYRRNDQRCLAYRPVCRNRDAGQRPRDRVVRGSRIASKRKRDNRVAGPRLGKRGRHPDIGVPGAFGQRRPVQRQGDRRWLGRGFRGYHATCRPPQKRQQPAPPHQPDQRGHRPSTGPDVALPVLDHEWGPST